MSHFQPVLERQGVDTSKIHSEFMSLRTALYLGAGWKKRLEGASWSQINRQYGDEFPNVLALIDLVLALPSSKADCERGFSAMKATKSDWRASLRSDTLSDLLMIKLESTDSPCLTLLQLMTFGGRMPWMYQKHADGLITPATGSPPKRNRRRMNQCQNRRKWMLTHPATISNSNVT